MALDLHWASSLQNCEGISPRSRGSMLSDALTDCKEIDSDGYSSELSCTFGQVEDSAGESQPEGHARETCDPCDHQRRFLQDCGGRHLPMRSRVRLPKVSIVLMAGIAKSLQDLAKLAMLARIDSVDTVRED